MVPYLGVFVYRGIYVAVAIDRAHDVAMAMSACSSMKCQVFVCLCACVSAYVRACVHLCMRVSVHACLCLCIVLSSESLL